MDPKVRKIVLILFLIAAVATIVIYFVSDNNIKLTWYTGGTAIALYLFYRFSKQ